MRDTAAGRSRYCNETTAFRLLHSEVATLGAQRLVDPRAIHFLALALRSGEKLILNAQFLVPERALPRFPVDTIAQVLLRDTVIGTVRVLSANASASMA